MTIATRPTALVTGASRGIGSGIALALAEAGYDVGVNYASSRQDAREVAEACRAVGALNHMNTVLPSAGPGLRADRVPVKQYESRSRVC